MALPTTIVQCGVAIAVTHSFINVGRSVACPVERLHQITVGACPVASDANCSVAVVVVPWLPSG